MAESQMTLYHCNPSYYSQKARLAFAEKNVPYNSRTVQLPEFENLQPWFMRLNPKGQVPALDTGSGLVVGSEDIINYLDKTHPQPQLVPTDDSATSVRVRQLYQQLDGISVPILTFGSFNHTELTEGALIPEAMRRKQASRFAGSKERETLQQFADQNPDLRDVYLAKIEQIKQRTESLFSKEALEAELAKTRTVLTDVESALANHSSQSAPWLGGATFGIADINLAILLIRMKNIGLSKPVWENGQMPNLTKYHAAVVKRPSVAQECFKMP